jgi:hypothetical protein
MRSDRHWNRTPLAQKLAAGSVQNKAHGSALGASFKGELGVSHRGEEVFLAFCKDLEPGLGGELSEHLSAFTRERQRDGRCELVNAGIAVEDLRVKRNLRVRLKWREFGERRRGIDRRHNARSAGVAKGWLALVCIVGRNVLGLDLRDPEVEHLHERRAVELARDEQVRRLEIAMHDAAGVRRAQRRQHTDRDVEHFLRPQLARFAQARP